MSDIFSPAKRREIMKSVRRERTDPEEALAALLAFEMIAFKRNVSKLPGKPDFVVRSVRLAIFVHGCFWHGHSKCRKGSSRPKTNSDYWARKIEANKKRDRRAARQLRHQGYSVYEVWACELMKGMPRRLVIRLGLTRKLGA